MRKTLPLLLAVILLILCVSCSTPIPGPTDIKPAEPPELDADRPELGDIHSSPETEGELLQNYLTVTSYAKNMSDYADALESYIDILKSMIADIQ